MNPRTEKLFSILCIIIQHPKITPLVPLNLLPPRYPVEETKQLSMV